ncbi:hypothetical protein KSX62_15165 [Enterobacter hormaechei]|uniref:hypothetical protein n=1 Tax=Enterobacter TaxID=547 RepID=UPI0012AF4098|nr:MULTISPECIES: hypothetical protein [Enterobacter]MBU8926390.1 hypothetical protein [Enterobacter hormaechei]MBU8930852.1 hypothetical protein [Enterobacter hormaechei]MBU8938068.1 hypothetical protein [Enterobacter hormaechei]MBU8947526.1 hypothetical protein [Enterobacter hormaechei]MBV1668401.1 hypothetical protein [Enterobacter hormaechei]
MYIQAGFNRQCLTVKGIHQIVVSETSTTNPRILHKIDGSASDSEILALPAQPNYVPADITSLYEDNSVAILQQVPSSHITSVIINRSGCDTFTVPITLVKARVQTPASVMITRPGATT